MSHFAKVENGIVTEVTVAEQDFIDSGAVGDPSLWVQTSYNTLRNYHPEGRPLRGNYASIGHTYDSINDVFIRPKPHDRAVLNPKTWDWDDIPRTRLSDIASSNTTTITTTTIEG